MSVCLQNVDILRPLQPQGHDLPPDPAIPTFAPFFEEPGTNAAELPSEPALPPAVQPEPVDPAPVYPVPVDPPVKVPLSSPVSSSSSESSEEDVVVQPKEQAAAGPFDSSSEEMGIPLALRPPLDFHYQRRDRKKRQALVESVPSHTPIFLADFPSGSSPFRSCPGPSRYTTV